ncbi:alpha-1,2-fucosyltransferase [Pseudanabaena sp. ABRG5-3]|uniref:alpha-1,2-fucosyltransferase n=1 Tax=Pseudanabaena sp. ABRG5-3 TaxID=685565 RepID=UPI000DC6F6C9|nr:alpha-1,2-fucosyltransferase [Pseudanabaena sp. ABRG5-3]BBC24666.1 glycosyl transferase family 11 [Pseudanabaena sp. ABRG5-3]
MIIVRLIGGLGNQMFQYAAARRLAEKHSTILKLDITQFETYKLRKYDLHCFHIWEHLATRNEINQILGNSQNIINRTVRKVSRELGLKYLQNNKLVRERSFAFDSNILDVPDNILLDGYWQSEKYFADITNILRREFVVKYQQDALSQRIADVIRSTESVSLHVRRTDYVQNAVTNKVHGTCDRDYYDRCVRYISERILNPHFFIFSDEPQWAIENLQISFPTTIVNCNNTSRDYEDIRLMSMCKHNIIANSSFSWWGAWLNSNYSKIVCAPKQWFADSSRDTRDIIPDLWIKL